MLKLETCENIEGNLVKYVLKGLRREQVALETFSQE